MSLRDNNWLQAQLDHIWDTYFSEVPQNNIVRIEFGRKAKYRLGSIKIDQSDAETSIITINSLFKDDTLPEEIVQATIVHELSHYAHGFNSPLPQKFSKPHAGGVMRQEFAERGLDSLYKYQRIWLKQNWPSVILENFGPAKPRVRRGQGPSVPKPFWFLR
jgi:hypothetical protein